MEAATTEPTPLPQTRQKRAEESTYTVQVMELVGIENAAGREAWFDVATVTVPARTRRKTVIEKGLQQAGLDVTEAIKVRALDSESAQVTPVAPYTPPSELRIG